ncbi:hypothetical protein [Natronosalvus rutilus]|uniref:Uncharacterized protein n=1 Tax=Natronosalvus rutilus TaxID=2953753 RepID=A0A9E7SZJ8_9EURY|nr:hypothetical protein [Natronosalvus rutilus]UTF55978.1 hypothetical protein NGM29_21025 [Natronosalvus rutilus]
MPDDTTDLSVEVRRNDYGTSGDVLHLKARQAERSMSNNIVTEGLLGLAGDIAGKRVNMGFENVKVQGSIQSTQEGTYPTGGNYPDINTDEWGRATEKEMALTHAFRTWGPNSADGFDTLIWGPREISGMFSKLTTTQNRGDNGPDQYTFSFEWSHTDVYVGDD